MELVAGRERRNRHSQPHPTAGCWGVITPQALYTRYMCPQARGWEFQMQSVPRTLMGTGVLWCFLGDELFLTHPGLGCAGEGAGSIPTTHSSYIPGHVPLPLWAHTPGVDGAVSLPHHVIPLLLLLILLVASPALVVWVKTSLPTTTPSGRVLYPPGWELWLPYPLPPDPPGGLCPGFTACPAASTLLDQVQLGSGGLGPRGITETPPYHWAVRRVTSHPRAE